MSRHDRRMFAAVVWLVQLLLACPVASGAIGVWIYYTNPRVDAEAQGYVTINQETHTVTIIKPCAKGKWFQIDAAGGDIASVTTNISQTTYNQFGPSLNHIAVELCPPGSSGSISTRDVGLLNLSSWNYDTILYTSTITGAWGSSGVTSMRADTIHSITAGYEATGGDIAGSIYVDSIAKLWTHSDGVIRANVTSYGVINHLWGDGGITGNISASSITNEIRTVAGTADLAGSVTVSGTINNLSIARHVTGNITAPTIYIGKGGTGNVHTTGGTVTTNTHLYVGEAYAGTYTLQGGGLTGTGDLTVATTGQLSGYASVGLSGDLVNNGRIKANGFGTDRTLSLASMASVGNTIDNASTDSYGWYATDHGILVLPDVPISGDGTYNWGEAAEDEAIDLVNSVQVEVPAGTTSGSMDISLLAPDHSAVNLSLPGGRSVIGVWFVRNTGVSWSTGTGTLTFRYDYSKATSCGVDDEENCLRLYARPGAGGNWGRVFYKYAPSGGTAGSVDTTNKWLVLPNRTALADDYAIVHQLPGDTEGDGDVDIFDVIDVVTAFGSVPGDPTWNPDADFDSSASVDVFDVIDAVNHFGQTCTGGTDGGGEGMQMAGEAHAAGYGLDQDANGLPDSCDVLRMAGEIGVIDQLPAETIERLLSECEACGF